VLAGERRSTDGYWPKADAVTLGTLTVAKLCLGLTDERTGKRYKSLIYRYDNLALTAYEPGGRGFKSCRARQIFIGKQPFPRLENNYQLPAG
jgi:hypothetical protein